MREAGITVYKEIFVNRTPLEIFLAVIFCLHKTTMITAFRNILIASGAYYLSWWLVYPLDFGYRKIIGRIIYEGNLGYAVVMPLVMNFPFALVAVGVGIAVVLLVESERPLGWALLPAVLYFYFAYTGHHWVNPPTSVDRTAQTIGAIVPAAACIGGALVARRNRKNSVGAISS